MSKSEANPLDLGVFIREQRRIAELAGVSNPYLSQIERGLRKPSAEILQQIAKALEISSETLYVRAGILDEDFGSPVSDVEEGPKPVGASCRNPRNGFDRSPHRNPLASHVPAGAAGYR